MKDGPASPTLKGSLGRLLASHQPFAIHRAAIVRLKDGQLTHDSEFRNGKELAEAVGQWHPPIGK